MRALLLCFTLGVTAARAIRWPNDFAEAHWLLDYRFGFVKRGLPGQLLSSGLRPFGASPNEAAIAIVAAVVGSALGAVLLWMAWRVCRDAGWSGASVLAALAFLSSPFVVMSAHLSGYFDGILVLLTVAAAALMLNGRGWAAGATAAVAMLVHESAIVVGFPVVCLAWWVAKSEGVRGLRAGAHAAAPLLLPIVAFGLVAASARFLPPDFQLQYSTRLARFPFVAGDMHVFVPEWLTPGVAEHIAEQRHRVIERLASSEMHGLVLATVAALLTYLMAAHRIRARSVTMLLVLAAVAAPQLLHAAAWDTVRIWTWSAAMAFLAVWVVARVRPTAGGVPAAVRLVAFGAIVLNVIASTPLYDGQAERFPVFMRLLLYAPVIAVSAWMFVRDDHRT